MERLVIGLDIDGVIVDAAGVMLPLLSEVCHRPVSRQEISCRSFEEALNIDQESVKYVWEQTLKNNLLRNAPPITGALDGLAVISQHEIWIVTARPAFLQHLTEAWFGERKVRYDRILFDRDGNKHLAGPRFDIFVEDFLEEANLIASAGIFTLLFNQPWNQAAALPGNCQRVYDWDAIVRLINRFEREP